MCTAYNFTEVIANLVKSYSTTSALKKDYKNLVNLYGKDEAVRLMKGYREAKQSQVADVADEASGHLTVSGLMEYAFKELSKGGKVNGALARLQSVYGQTDKSTDWESFLAKYYPHTMEGGKPAKAVNYTKDGSEVYTVYEPLEVTTVNSVGVLLKALSSLSKGAQRVFVSGKPRLAWSEVHTAGSITAAYSSKIVHEVLQNSEGETISDKYRVEKVEKVDFPDGLKLTGEHITVKEFTQNLNSKE